MTGAVPVRPRRDRPTLVSYAQLALYGFFLYSFGPSMAMLREEQGTTRAMSALHSTAFAVAGVVAGLCAAGLVRRLGRGAVLRLGSLTMAAGLALYTSGLPLTATLAGIAVTGFGGTLLLIGVNAFLSAHQGPAAPATLNEANGLAALVGLLGPLTLGAGVALAIGWRAGLWTAMLALVALEVWRGGDLPRYDEVGHPATPHEPATVRPAAPDPATGTFGWAIGVAALLVGTEFCLSLWGADLLRDRGGMGAAGASAALVCLVGGMAAGRFAGAWVVERVDPERVLGAGIVLAAAGFAVMWSSASPVPMLAGLVVTGLGAGVHWPLAVARTIRAGSGRPDRAAGLTSMAGSAAAGVAPFALGALADAVGVHAAFLVVPVLLGTALAVVVLRPVPA